MVDSSAYNLDLIFQALADPTRRSILRSVARRRRTVTEIAKPFRLSLAGISKHLKVLERARLIQREKSGGFCHVRLNPEALMSAERWMAYYQQFWETRLVSLKTILEKDHE